jgi:hypothetical protein
MTQLAYAGILASLALVVLLRAAWLKVETDDVPCTYKLFAARDALIRLVVEGRLRRDDPFFVSLYGNVNVLLCSSRLLSGRPGWPLAEYTGKVFAHQPGSSRPLIKLPPGKLPSALEPVANDLQQALQHLVENHFGIWLQIDANQREARKIQKEQARQFLQLLPVN